MEAYKDLAKILAKVIEDNVEGIHDFKSTFEAFKKMQNEIEIHLNGRENSAKSRINQLKTDEPVTNKEQQ